MNSELHRELSSIAYQYEKTDELNSYVKHSENCMYLNEENHYVKFNHLGNEAVAMKLVRDIQSVLNNFGYHPVYKGREPISKMLYVYLIVF